VGRTVGENGLLAMLRVNALEVEHFNMVMDVLCLLELPSAWRNILDGKTPSLLPGRLTFRGQFTREVGIHKTHSGSCQLLL
jgi:hypothetical protein